MPDFTRKEVIAKVDAEQSLNQADLRDTKLSDSKVSEKNWMDKVVLSYAKYNGEIKFLEDFDT